ncbi:MAG: aminotransferase class IV [Thermodesulfobacteriota bacterium]
MDLPIFSAADLAARHDDFKRPWHDNFLAMYSSLWGGIVTDPVLMTVPVDDHLVHRADGVFDVSKCVGGNIYCFRRHLDRLERSARGLELALPEEYGNILGIAKACLRVAGRRDVLLRIMVSRGPGGFSTNPTECPRSILYVVVSKIHPPQPEAYEKGVAIVSAPVPVKPAPQATIKSCDYLGNVMIKKAAVQAGVDYAVNWDENGFLAEGSTENILLVTPDKVLLTPEFGRVLKGITLTRVLELGEDLAREGLLKDSRTASIDRELAGRCPEVMLCGTTLDVLPVTAWDGRTVGDGRPGPIARRLLELLRRDIRENKGFQTPVFD